MARYKSLDCSTKKLIDGWFYADRRIRLNTMFKHVRLTRQFAVTVDVVIVVLSFVVAFYVRIGLLSIVSFGERTSIQDYAGFLAVIALVWWMLLNAQGAYISQRYTSLITEYRSVLRTTVFGTLAIVLVVFILRLSSFPRSLIVIFAPTSFCILIVEKTLVYYIVGRMRERGYDRKAVLVVGTGELAEEFTEAIHEYGDWGLEVTGFLTDAPLEVGSKKYGAMVLGTIDDLESILHKRVIHEVILALPARDLGKAPDILSLCEQEGVRARLISDCFRTMIAKLQVHEIHGMPVLTFSTTSDKEWQLFAKHIMDVVVSSAALIVLSPVFLIISILVKLTSKGLALYEWNVVGVDKRCFKGYKFRSMVDNADELKAKLMAQNEMSGPAFKMKNDPRVTPLGRILRKFSLDELPQLWSVLKGDMSLVGPRPALVTEVDRFESWHRRKFSVKPGLTCLWQVSGRSEIKDFDEWAKMDLEYIDNWSLWLDFKILLKTIPVVLLGKGAR